MMTILIYWHYCIVLANTGCYLPFFAWPGGWAQADSVVINQIGTTQVFLINGFGFNNGSCFERDSTEVEVECCNLTAPIITSNGACIGHPLVLSITNPISGTTYSWSDPNLLAHLGTTLTRTNATSAMSGIYTVIATNAAGCTSTASITVAVGLDCCPTPPNYMLVGSAVGIPTFSSAIQQGFLQDTFTMRNVSQRIHVRGTFTQDLPSYTFAAGTDIILDNGAEIVVAIEKSLELLDTAQDIVRVRGGCDKLAKGIRMEGNELLTEHVMISNCEYGLHVMTGDLYIRHTTFRNNFVGGLLRKIKFFGSINLSLCPLY